MGRKPAPAAHRGRRVTGATFLYGRRYRSRITDRVTVSLPARSFAR
jgi:hypothetical protein